MIKEEWLKVLIDYVHDIFPKSKQLTVKNNVTDDEIVLSNLACLIEEVWELSAEVRKKLKVSFSAKKVSTFEKENLEDEAVDCLITLLLLLESVWVKELDQAIHRKIKTNDNRGYR